MNTLTPLHDELDASLALILDRIDTQAMEARWRLEDMYWDGWPYQRTRPFPILIIDPMPRSWQEQKALWERYQEGMGIAYAIPGSLHLNSSHRRGGAIDLELFDEIPSKRLSDLLTGHAFDRVLGNEPWHFEFTPTKLPWWKHLYRKIMRWFR